MPLSAMIDRAAYHPRETPAYAHDGQKIEEPLSFQEWRFLTPYIAATRFFDSAVI